MRMVSWWLLGTLLGALGGCAGSGGSPRAGAPTNASPLTSSQGPFQVIAREIRLRGADQQLEPKPEIRIENNLRVEKICDVRIRGDGNWSANMLVTKDCLVPSSATIVIPPASGEWMIKVETNGGKTQTAVVQLNDVPVGISFAD
jgi:hypothetical protein